MSHDSAWIVGSVSSLSGEIYWATGVRGVGSVVFNRDGKNYAADIELIELMLIRAAAIYYDKRAMFSAGHHDLVISAYFRGAEFR